MPNVSIVIPMRNAAAFIGDAVRTLLVQDADLEVIVVDDGSTDASADIVLGLGDGRIRIIDGPQRGISAAFNAGLAQARGQYLARCDADDLYVPGRLGRQVKWLEDRPNYLAVAGGYATIDPRGKLVQDHAVHDGAQDVTAELCTGTGRSHVCAYLYRTEALRRIHGCREWFVTSEDADLQFRLACTGLVGYQPMPAYLYRLHDASITHTQPSARRLFYEQMAREFLAQRLRTGTDDLDRGQPPEPPTDFVVHAARSSAEQIQQMHIGYAWKAWREQHRGKAINLAWRATLSRPISPAGWKTLALVMLKRPCPPTP